MIPAIDIVTGQPAAEILAAASRAGADLVVMGTQGLGGARKLVFGSTTDAVVREAAIPVLAVPEYEPERVEFGAGTARVTFNHVVAAVGLDAYDRVVTRTAAAWAQAFGAGLTLSHVWRRPHCQSGGRSSRCPCRRPSRNPPRSPAARSWRWPPALGLPAPATIDVRRGSIPGTIATVVRERAAGLLVVSRGGTAHRVGTIAYRVMREADIPTLIVARP